MKTIITHNSIIRDPDGLLANGSLTIYPASEFEYDEGPERRKVTKAAIIAKIVNGKIYIPTYRFTYTGTGTDPLIGVGAPTIGETVTVASKTFDPMNNGIFKVTASGPNYFEVTNTKGVVESSKSIGTAGSISFGPTAIGDVTTEFSITNIPGTITLAPTTGANHDHANLYYQVDWAMRSSTSKQSKSWGEYWVLDAATADIVEITDIELARVTPSIPILRGPSGSWVGDIDEGDAQSIYGGLPTFDEGNASTVYGE